jgi:hypothetical protein
MWRLQQRGGTEKERREINTDGTKGYRETGAERKRMRKRDRRGGG